MTKINRSESVNRQKKADREAKNYIISCINSENYNVQTTTEKEKLQFFYTCFIKEYDWSIKRHGMQKALAEYFQGLPSCCTIAFWNDDILMLAKQWGSLMPDATEAQEDKIIKNYFNWMANKTMQLFRAYKIGEVL